MPPPKVSCNFYQEILPDCALGPREFKIITRARDNLGISAQEFRKFLKWTCENWVSAVTRSRPYMQDLPTSESKWKKKYNKGVVAAKEVDCTEVP